MQRRTFGLFSLLLGLCVIGLCTNNNPAYGQKKAPALATNEQVKIFPLETKADAAEREVNDWLDSTKPKIVSIRLIPAHDENTALVVFYEKKTTDDRTQKLKLFYQEEKLASFEKRVNRWLDTEKATIVARDVTLTLHTPTSNLQMAYVYATK